MAHSSAPPVLTTHQLRLALLDRQLLLDRADRAIPDALERVGGLQTQYAPSGYVGLWSRLAGFERMALTRALEDRTAIQATLLRTTIHLVSRRDFWAYAMGVRAARRTWWLRLQKGAVTELDAAHRAEGLRVALADGPRDVRELGPGASGFIGSQGLWVDLVRVPPSGTWERRRADRLALAEQWVGPPDVTEADGLRHLVRAYLRGFGPGAWSDIASWAGVPATVLREATDGIALTRYRDEAGRELLDLPGSDLPDLDVPTPVRFLPHWDASLLVHARRTLLLPEAHRPRVFSDRNPFSVGAVLVNGQVAGSWSLRDGRVQVDPFLPLSGTARDAVADEAVRLTEFHR
jgi:hypothetical protein